MTRKPEDLVKVAKQIEDGELVTYEKAAETLGVCYHCIPYYLKHKQLEKRKTRYGKYITKESIESLMLAKLGKAKRGRKSDKEKGLSKN